MLTPFAELLRMRRAGTAVGAFTCYDLEAAAGVLRAAATAGAGVILLVGDRSYRDRDGALLLAALVAAASAADARACVQLDHCDDAAVIRAALSGGAGAVLADGSRLPYAANVAFVAGAVEVARSYGAGVEAELGSITGDEDVADAVAAGALTDPAQAVDLMQRTGADCLAVSIGNVHGHYREPPALDLVRLEAIHALVDAPLALHGASGLDDALVARTIEAGVAKVNVNTELRAAYLETTAGVLPAVADGARLASLHAAQIAAIEAVVSAKIRAFSAARP
jgi:tagatose 1,6-diphosphate aldolase GatY/KbaY